MLLDIAQGQGRTVISEGLEAMVERLVRCGYFLVMLKAKNVASKSREETRILIEQLAGRISHFSMKVKDGLEWEYMGGRKASKERALF